MFDNLKSEITEYKQKAAERAEKADYYRKTLETERATREQADKQIIDLLHDVRNRYDIKLNSYMAKNNQKSNEAENKKPSDTDHVDGANSKKNNKKGGGKKGKTNDNSTNEPKESNKQVDEAADDGWGSTPSNNEDTNKNQGWGWGNDTAGDKKGESNDNNDSKSSNEQLDTAASDKKSRGKKGKANDNSTNESKGSNKQMDNAADDGWGSTTNNNEDTNTNQDWGWGNDTTCDKKNGVKKGKTSDDGTNKSKGSNKQTDKASDDGWGSTTNNNEDTNSNQDWGWGNDTAGDKMEESNDSNISKSSNEQVDTAASDKKGRSKKSKTNDNNTNKPKGSNKQADKAADDGWGSTPSNNKDTTTNQDWGWGNDTTIDKKVKSNDTQPKTTDKPSNAEPSDKVAVATGVVQDPGEQKTYPPGSKEYLDLKSQLWTAKLDLRLVERDKAKLTEEVAALRSERVDFIKKLGQSNVEQDTLRVKVRGLTVDLVSANEEINKLNERIDELEAEKINRDRDVSAVENRRRSTENRFKLQQQQIVELQSEMKMLKEEKVEYRRKIDDLTRRNERLQADLTHSKNLIRTLKDGCALVEGQAKTFEVRHDTVLMSKADLERELIAIKEESSSHITTINNLQTSNQQLSEALIKSVESHEVTRKEVENLQHEYSRRLDHYKTENERLSILNQQMRKLIDVTISQQSSRKH